MLTRLFYIMLLILIVSLTHSCQEKKCSNPINPNGDSELTLLMRDMFDDAMKVKLELKEGQHNGTLKKYNNIKSATATEPEKSKTDLYQAMADSYLFAVDEVNSASTIDDAKKKFNSLVTNCMSCHKSMCPGPMVRIKKLYLKEENSNQ